VKAKVQVLQAQVETFNNFVKAIAFELEKAEPGAKRRIALAAAATIRENFADDKLKSLRDLCLTMVARMLRIPFGSLANWADLMPP
jgi:hypothetical protein